MSNLNASTLVSGSPKPGDVIGGKYRVERTLGSGGMGVVVAAVHLDLDERVAIKLLLPHLVARLEVEDTVARFLQEARTAIKIRNKHVVRVLDVGRVEGGTPYIVMEYLEGRDLALLLADEGPLPVPAAVDYLLQACEALAEAHALGIVHRDLKPGNLFLTVDADGDPCLKVLDFGISKVTAQAGGPRGGASTPITSTTAVLGTPSFMSPEQMRSSRDVDARADVWSLGAILYAFLTGVPPYRGESTADVCAKIIRDPPPSLRDRLPDAPDALGRTIERCLEKSPDDRYGSVAELAAALVPFGSASAKESHGRIARALTASGAGRSPWSPGSGGTAITGASTPVGGGAPPPRVLQTPVKLVPTSEGGTRTASAWEDTRLHGKAWGNGARVLLLALGALAAAAAGAGIVIFAGSWHRTAGSATVSVTAAPPSIPVANEAGARDDLAPGGPAASAASVGASAGAASIAIPTVAVSALPVTRGGPASPATVTNPAKAARPPAAPSTPRSGDDLFDGRK